ncbi:TNFAIP3-interacting protein 2 [Chelonoidis abingdonii]|uniref:TNFAIP3-interacting protein 2 n=1 Tax=Chelonoidis abingdonii TaxID=106734 RepID=A0A8C0G4Y2_CHEAB|nr:TNFAIP3-interacting protein 2 [Chelonoidis abingdonii]
MQLGGLLFCLLEEEKRPRGDLCSLSPTMCSVNEDSSTDPLVARCRQLEETVEKLLLENKSLKSKVPRYKAICNLYHESGQQLKHLQMQLSAKEAMIGELRASVAKYQAVQLGATQEEEQQPSPPGGKFVEPAKSLVESLIDQVGQMKQQLQDSERISAQKVETLSQEVQKLNRQLEEKDRDIQQIISQPQYEKEREILQLQRSLAEREKVQATSEVLCRSLTDETHQLQRKLASTAEMCQQLAKCLEEKRKDRGYLEEHIPIDRSNQLQFSENKTSPQTIICQLQEENRKLQQKVFHVEDLNTKWQAYDASREEYVKRLHLQLKEPKSQPEQQQRNSELMQKEISRLNKLLEEKMNECIKVKRELEDVKKAKDGDRERVQMLEQQVLVYKDDFTSERADRERAQSKIQELQAEVACLQHQLTRRQESRDTTGHVRVHSGNQNHRVYVQTNVEHLLGNSQVQSGVRRTGSQSEQPATRTDSGSSGSERRGQGELQCPHCMRFFNDELSDEFLRHVAECCQ